VLARIRASIRARIPKRIRARILAPVRKQALQERWQEQSLRAAQEEWSRTGHVPRSAERELDQRWRDAVDAVTALGERARQDKLARQYLALGEHLGLCRDVEQKLARGENLDQSGLASLRRQWTQTPDTKPEHERLLRGRFEKALLALENQDAQHLAQLRENQPLLQREVLRLEILNGQPSPPELAQERLRLQVEVLKSSLGAGEKPVTADLQLLQLCAMPALSDAGMAARIDRLLALGARLPANKAVISG
jgi:exonuclease SbcC